MWKSLMERGIGCVWTLRSRLPFLSVTVTIGCLASCFLVAIHSFFISSISFFTRGSEAWMDSLGSLERRESRSVGAGADGPCSLPQDPVHLGTNLSFFPAQWRVEQDPDLNCIDSASPNTAGVPANTLLYPLFLG